MQQSREIDEVGGGADDGATGGGGGGELSPSAIESFLTSPAVKGVGPKLAVALVSRFGSRTLAALRGEDEGIDDDALLAVAGLGEKTLVRLRKSLREWSALADAQIFARGLGCLSEAQVATLTGKYAEATESAVRADPCVL